jgi:hypothetical protein
VDYWVRPTITYMEEKMKILKLEDLAGMTVKEIRDHLVEEYEATRDEVNKYEILVAYESVGSWGCDSSSFFLLREKKTGKLYEVHGSHCSCMGFEGQFSPEKTTKTYLKSSKFNFWCGGYDGNETENQRLVKEFMKKI